MPQVKVECYAGYKGDERPVRFALGGREYSVVEITDQWYSPGAVYFRVRADDGNVYILRHADTGLEDNWSLESYRRAR